MSTINHNSKVNRVKQQTKLFYRGGTTLQGSAHSIASHPPALATLPATKTLTFGAKTEVNSAQGYLSDMGE